MRTLLVALAGVVLLAACGSSPQLSDHAANVICLEMTMDGPPLSHWMAVDATAKSEGIADPEDRKRAIIAAVSAHCSRYLSEVTW